MKTKLLRKIRKAARKNVYIVAPKHFCDDYYIQVPLRKIKLMSFYDENDFKYAERCLREIRREYMVNYLYSYKRDQRRKIALKELNKFTF